MPVCIPSFQSKIQNRKLPCRSPDRATLTAMHALFLNLLLSASLLAHTVLGCCWHHAHGQECAEQTADAPAAYCHADHATDDCDADRHGTPSLAVCDSHHHSPPCDEPDCTFVKAGSSKSVLAQSMALAVLLPPVATSARARHLLDRADEHGSATVSGAALRALLQVWLT